MIKRLLGGGLVAATGLLGLTAPAAHAQVARPASALPGLHVTNLHAAYERALPTARSGRPSGIAYPIGHAPRAASPRSGAARCTEPACNLTYQGGPVQTDPRIYLLLWGPNWTADSGQASSAAYLESFYKGLGAQPQDTWSTVTAQYTDTAGGFPGMRRSVFAGVYNDVSAPPHGATQNQLAAEANAFATAHHLTGDINAQIVIATQSGTCPAGFYSPTICNSGSTGYCAWHDYAQNTGVSYTNLPYLLDAGYSCGKNFINSGSAGLHDGFSIIGGHEYAESVTDPRPSTGWIDTSDAVSGGEVADKCAWRSPMADVTLSTGSFAMQSLWTNATSTCVLSPSSDTLSVTDPGSQYTAVGTRVDVQVYATPSTKAKLEFSATGLPAGLSIGRTTGLITGTPSTAGSAPVTVTVDDTTGAVTTTSFTWHITTNPDTVTVSDPGSQVTTAGTSVRLQIKATSGTGATLMYAATNLPAGLTIARTTGVISGTPSTAGSASVAITASDTTGGQATTTFTWKIKAAPDTVTVTSPGNQNSTANQRISLPISASSTAGKTLTYSAGNLPPGLSIDSSSGLISGRLKMLAKPLSTKVTITVSDNGSASAKASFTWTVTPVTGRLRGYRTECATDSRWSDTPGTPVVIRTCNNLWRERWTLGPNYSLIVHGLCLTDPGWGRWGTRLVLEPCTGWKNQQWHHQANGQYVVAVHRLCLTDPHWSTRGGTQLILQSCRDWKNQRWSRP